MQTNNSNTPEHLSSLVFKIGEESIPTIYDSNNFNSSPFFQAINKGMNLVCKLLNNNVGVKVLPCEEDLIKTDNLKKQICNNVIAFLGDRGSGKTSCMLSVVNLVQRKADRCNNPYEDSVDVFDVIDPSFFDSSHNITDIFIGEFYRKYEILSKEYNKLPDAKRSELKELQAEFKRVKNAFQYLNPDYAEAPLDDIDALSRLSSGVELSRSLSKLVDCYLKYIEKKALILVVDDLDLNIDSSYRMMEEIRRYLVMPNVVILLGANLNQLKLGITSSFTKYRNDNLLDSFEIDEMAVRFLDKFIPATARVFMPDPVNIINSRLTVENAEGKSMSYQSVAFAVPSLIYQKTRFLFYNHDGTPSMIIPRNLREIRMLVSALTLMQDPDDSDTNIHIANKYFFKKYFRDQWIPTLAPAYQNFAIDLMEESDITKVNKNTVSFLSSASVSFKAWLDIQDDLAKDFSSSTLLRLRLRDINNAANANSNITVGDVMAMASAIGEIENNYKMARLVFFIQTFYSMKLYELYDEMTAPENLDGNGVIEKVDTPQTVPLLKNAKSVVMPDYLTLAAGDFFLLTGDSFIPFSRTRVSREIRLINGDILNDSIKDIVNKLYDKEKKECRQANEMQIATLRLIEFFVLCARRSLTLKKSEFTLTKRDNWREFLDPSYITPLNSTKNIIFEVSAPFFNLVYPKFAYQRFSHELYELALSCKDSLLNSILNNRRRDNDRSQYADLMSRICIRNIEVLADLNKWLAARKDILRADNGDARKILIQFFRQFSPEKTHYSVKTYDLKGDDTGYHEIEFNPIVNLADAIDFESSEFLKSITDPLPLISLFEKIYSPMEEIQENIHYSQKEFSNRVLDIDAPDSMLVDNWITEVFKQSDAETMTAQNLIKGLLDNPPISNMLLQRLFTPNLRDRYREEYLGRSRISIGDLNVSIRKVTNEIRALRRNAFELNKKLAGVQADLESGKESFKKLSDDRLAKSEKAKNLMALMTKIQNKIIALSEQRDEIANINIKVVDSKTNPEFENKDTDKKLQHSLNEIDSKIQDFKAKHFDNDAKRTKVQEEISILDNDLSIQQSILDKARNQHDHLLEQLNSLNSQINDREMRKEDLTIMKKKLESDYKDLEKKLKISSR